MSEQRALMRLFVGDKRKFGRQNGRERKAARRAGAPNFLNLMFSVANTVVRSRG
jgi:hypothetical protein